MNTILFNGNNHYSSCLTRLNRPNLTYLETSEAVGKINCSGKIVECICNEDDGFSLCGVMSKEI